MSDERRGDGEAEGPPPPSPLTGGYLLVLLPQLHSPQHKDRLLHALTKGLITWDAQECHVDLDKELQNITAQAPEGEEAKNGERLIQFASENLVTEVLIHPQLNTLVQCMRNCLSSFTRHRHIIHAGYTSAGNGAWVLQDGTYSFSDFADMYSEHEVQRVLRAYEGTVSVDVHCSGEGDWWALKAKDPFSKVSRVRLNPPDKGTTTTAVRDFLNYLSQYLVPAGLTDLLEPSDVVGNIRFSHPTLYVFPGGQGDAALFGINGFNMLVDGGFSRKACFWDFTRHLDRLDSVLMTRINNGNLQGLASLLKRKRSETVYPQIGHFFSNIPDRKQVLSPDGDKDRDPLLINLIEQGQEMLSGLRHLGLKPQSCYREPSVEPINLYHKVGHGKLDMYVLSPAKDSREVREFLAKWAAVDSKIFCSYSRKGEFNFPLSSKTSICALLVWQPANPEDNITRLLFPGSTPQQKIFEGLDRLKNLEFMKHPICSAKSLSPTSSTIKLSIKSTPKPAIIEKVAEIEKKQSETVKAVKQVGEIKKPTPPPPKPKPKADRPKEKPKTDLDSKPETVKIDRKTTEAVQKVEKEVKKEKPKRAMQKPQEKKTQKPPEKKTDSVKSSPTTPKKTVENKLTEMAATRTEIKTRASKAKASPTSTPAKSAKEENNRKVVELKSRESTKLQKAPPTRREEPKKIEKSVGKKPTASPKGVKSLSPIKAAKQSAKHRLDVKKTSKPEKDIITDSSAVSTPSTVDAELTKAKEEAEKTKEICESKLEDASRKASEDTGKSISKEDDDEILIIEKVEISDEITGKADVEKIALHLQKLDEEKKKKPKEQKTSAIEEKETADTLSQEKTIGETIPSPETKQVAQEEVQDIIETATEIVTKRLDTQKTDSQEISGKDLGSTEKIITPKEKEMKSVDVEQKIDESQPDERFSTTVESGATTTAPTLPEDERIPLDEIKEGIEEKHVKEETKEKEIIATPRPEQLTSLPQVPVIAGTVFDQRAQLLKDIVKTPDEVADLPVHEEVDVGIYEGAGKDELLSLPPTKKEKKDETTEELKLFKDNLEKEDKSKDLKEDMVESVDVLSHTTTDLDMISSSPKSGKPLESDEKEEVQEDEKDDGVEKRTEKISGLIGIEKQEKEVKIPGMNEQVLDKPEESREITEKETIESKEKEETKAPSVTKLQLEEIARPSSTEEIETEKDEGVCLDETTPQYETKGSIVTEEKLEKEGKEDARLEEEHTEEFLLDIGSKDSEMKIDMKEMDKKLLDEKEVEKIVSETVPEVQKEEPTKLEIDLMPTKLTESNILDQAEKKEAIGKDILDKENQKTRTEDYKEVIESEVGTDSKLEKKDTIKEEIVSGEKETIFETKPSELEKIQEEAKKTSLEPAKAESTSIEEHEKGEKESKQFVTEDKSDIKQEEDKESFEEEMHKKTLSPEEKTLASEIAESEKIGGMEHEEIIKKETSDDAELHEMNIKGTKTSEPAIEETLLLNGKLTDELEKPIQISLTEKEVEEIIPTELKKTETEELVTKDVIKMIGELAPEDMQKIESESADLTKEEIEPSKEETGDKIEVQSTDKDKPAAEREAKEEVIQAEVTGKIKSEIEESIKTEIQETVEDIDVKKVVAEEIATEVKEDAKLIAEVEKIETKTESTETITKAKTDTVLDQKYLTETKLSEDLEKIRLEESVLVNGLIKEEMVLSDNVSDSLTSDNEIEQIADDNIFKKSTGEELESITKELTVIGFEHDDTRTDEAKKSPSSSIIDKDIKAEIKAMDLTAETKQSDEKLKYDEKPTYDEIRSAQLKIDDDIKPSGEKKGAEIKSTKEQKETDIETTEQKEEVGKTIEEKKEAEVKPTEETKEFEIKTSEETKEVQIKPSEEIKEAEIKPIKKKDDVEIKLIKEKKEVEIEPIVDKKEGEIKLTKEEMEAEQKQTEEEKEFETKLTEIGKETEVKETEKMKDVKIKPTEEEKVVEIKPSQETKKSEFKLTEEKKEDEIKIMEEKKETGEKNEVDMKPTEELKKSEIKAIEEKTEDKIKSSEIKTEVEIKLIEQKKEAEIKITQEDKLAEIKTIEETIEGEIKLTEDEKEAEIKPIEEKKESEVKPTEEKEKVEIKPCEEIKEAEIKTIEEKIEAEIKFTREERETELKLVEEKIETEIKLTEPKKEAEIKPIEGEKVVDIKTIEEKTEAEIKPGEVKPTEEKQEAERKLSEQKKEAEIKITEEDKVAEIKTIEGTKEDETKPTVDKQEVEVKPCEEIKTIEEKIEAEIKPTELTKIDEAKKDETKLTDDKKEVEIKPSEETKIVDVEEAKLKVEEKSEIVEMKQSAEVREDKLMTTEEQKVDLTKVEGKEDAKPTKDEDIASIPQKLSEQEKEEIKITPPIEKAEEGIKISEKQEEDKVKQTEGKEILKLDETFIEKDITKEEKQEEIKTDKENKETELKTAVEKDLERDLVTEKKDIESKLVKETDDLEVKYESEKKDTEIMIGDTKIDVNMKPVEQYKEAELTLDKEKKDRELETDVTRKDEVMKQADDMKGAEIKSEDKKDVNCVKSEATDEMKEVEMKMEVAQIETEIQLSGENKDIEIKSADDKKEIELKSAEDKKEIELKSEDVDALLEIVGEKKETETKTDKSIKEVEIKTTGEKDETDEKKEIDLKSAVDKTETKKVEFKSAVSEDAQLKKEEGKKEGLEKDKGGNKEDEIKTSEVKKEVEFKLEQDKKEIELNLAQEKIEIKLKSAEKKDIEPTPAEEKEEVFKISAEKKEQERITLVEDVKEIETKPIEDKREVEITLGQENRETSIKSLEEKDLELIKAEVEKKETDMKPDKSKEETGAKLTDKKESKVISDEENKDFGPILDEVKEETKVKVETSNLSEVEKESVQMSYREEIKQSEEINVEKSESETGKDETKLKLTDDKILDQVKQVDEKKENEIKQVGEPEELVCQEGSDEKQTDEMKSTDLKTETEIKSTPKNQEVQIESGGEMEEPTMKRDPVKQEMEQKVNEDKKPIDDKQPTDEITDHQDKKDVALSDEKIEMFPGKETKDISVKHIDDDKSSKILTVTEKDSVEILDGKIELEKKEGMSFMTCIDSKDGPKKDEEVVIHKTLGDEQIESTYEKSDSLTEVKMIKESEAIDLKKGVVKEIKLEKESYEEKIATTSKPVGGKIEADTTVLKEKIVPLADSSISEIKSTEIKEEKILHTLHQPGTIVDDGKVQLSGLLEAGTSLDDGIVLNGQREIESKTIDKICETKSLKVESVGSVLVQSQTESETKFTTGLDTLIQQREEFLLVSSKEQAKAELESHEKIKELDIKSTEEIQLLEETKLTTEDIESKIKDQSEVDFKSTEGKDKPEVKPDPKHKEVIEQPECSKDIETKLTDKEHSKDKATQDKEEPKHEQLEDMEVFKKIIEDEKKDVKEISITGGKTELSHKVTEKSTKIVEDFEFLEESIDKHTLDHKKGLFEAEDLREASKIVKKITDSGSSEVLVMQASEIKTSEKEFGISEAIEQAKDKGFSKSTTIEKETSSEEHIGYLISSKLSGENGFHHEGVLEESQKSETAKKLESSLDTKTEDKTSKTSEEAFTDIEKKMSDTTFETHSKETTIHGKSTEGKLEILTSESKETVLKTEQSDGATSNFTGKAGSITSTEKIEDSSSSSTVIITEEGRSDKPKSTDHPKAEKGALDSSIKEEKTEKIKDENILTKLPDDIKESTSQKVEFLTASSIKEVETITSKEHLSMVDKQIKDSIDTKVNGFTDSKLTTEYEVATSTSKAEGKSETVLKEYTQVGEIRSEQKEMEVHEITDLPSFVKVEKDTANADLKSKMKDEKQMDIADIPPTDNVCSMPGMEPSTEKRTEEIMEVCSLKYTNGEKVKSEEHSSGSSETSQLSKKHDETSIEQITSLEKTFTNGKVQMPKDDTKSISELETKYSESTGTEGITTITTITKTITTTTVPDESKGVESSKNGTQKTETAVVTTEIKYPLETDTPIGIQQKQVSSTSSTEGTTEKLEQVCKVEKIVTEKHEIESVKDVSVIKAKLISDVTPALNGSTVHDGDSKTISKTETILNGSLSEPKKTVQQSTTEGISISSEILDSIKAASSTHETKLLETSKTEKSKISLELDKSLETAHRDKSTESVKEISEASSSYVSTESKQDTLKDLSMIKDMTASFISTERWTDRRTDTPEGRATPSSEATWRESDEDLPPSPLSTTSHLHSPPPAMYSSMYVQDDDSDISFGKPDIDFETAAREHIQTRGETLPKDPIEKWGKPLGLPPPPSGKNYWSPFKEWGRPLHLPSPAPAPAENDTEDTSGSAKTTPKKVAKMNEENNRYASNIVIGKEANNKNRRSDSPVKRNMKESKKAGMGHIYLDLSYVPHHGNSHYANVEFFKRVRARYYVFSGTEPSKEVFNALLEAKQQWEDKDLEVTIIPTYDTDTLGYWIAENEETLSKYKIDLSPSASRCTINLQDHDTSCSAYRLEF